MKPVGLVAYPIQNSCMSNCIVLDPFGGSGSTLIACEQTSRICYIAVAAEETVAGLELGEAGEREALRKLLRHSILHLIIYHRRNP